MLLTACGWHFKNNELLPIELKTLIFESSDPYNEMSRILRGQLLLNDVKLVENDINASTLRLNSIENSDSVASVFKQAREAEKILIVQIKASVSIPHKGIYPINVAVHRSFFEDSRAALAKSVEQEVIIRDMYEQASRQIIVKMIGLHKSLSVQKN